MDERPAAANPGTTLSQHRGAWGVWAQGDCAFYPVRDASMACELYRANLARGSIGVSTHPPCVDGLRARALARENAALRASLIRVAQIAHAAHGGRGSFRWCAADACRAATEAEAGSPTPDRVAALEAEVAADDALLAERDRLLDALPCPAHGRCVPHALERVAALEAVEVLAGAVWDAWATHERAAVVDALTGPMDALLAALGPRAAASTDKEQP